MVRGIGQYDVHAKHMCKNFSHAHQLVVNMFMKYDKFEEAVMNDRQNSSKEGMKLTIVLTQKAVKMGKVDLLSVCT